MNDTEALRPSFLLSTSRPNLGFMAKRRPHSAEVLRQLFGGPVATALALPSNCALFAQEEALIEKAVMKRRREFSTGRSCAREALARLGAPPAPILKGKSGAPIFPTGFVGSISHCDDLCWAVAAERSEFNSLGCDIELAVPLPDELVGSICLSIELAHHNHLPVLDRSTWPAVTFSAKEAFYKCHHAIVGEFIGFHEIALTFTVFSCGKQGGFSAAVAGADKAASTIAREIRGRWRISRQHIYTAATLRSVS